MRAESNLLVCLKRWASGQDENFTTDALAHLLRYLSQAAPQAAERILSFLAGAEICFKSQDVGPVAILTQEACPPYGVPDIKIETNDILLLVEVKVSSPVDRQQLAAYLKILEEDPRQRKSLSLLAPSPTPDEAPEGVHLIRWFDLSEALKSLLVSPEMHEANTAFLLSQLLEYLSDQRLALARVRSRVSEGMRRYEEAIGKRLCLDVKVTKALVATEPDLGSLWDLLTIMREAWLEVNPGHSLKFGSGKNAGGWIGWNVNNMDYFLSLYYSNPELVDIQLWNNVDERKWDKSRGDLALRFGAWRWNNVLDLGSDQLLFFEKSSAAQKQLLAEFVKENYEYAQHFRKDLDQ